jgi:FRG1-like domain
MCKYHSAHLLQTFFICFFSYDRKQFQKFQDKRMKINPEGKDSLKVAKKEGKLHEVMLDRRAKMKADRYCK